MVNLRHALRSSFTALSSGFDGVTELPDARSARSRPVRASSGLLGAVTAVQAVIAQSPPLNPPGLPGKVFEQTAEGAAAPRIRARKAVRTLRVLPPSSGAERRSLQAGRPLLLAPYGMVLRAALAMAAACFRPPYPGKPLVERLLPFREGSYAS